GGGCWAAGASGGAARLLRTTSRMTGDIESSTMTAMMGSRYLSTDSIVEPSRYPAMISPTDQNSPPTTCQIVKVRVFTPSAPTMGLSTVLTIPMNLASTMALP